jgi:hypothetical protein
MAGWRDQLPEGYDSADIAENSGVLPVGYIDPDNGQLLRIVTFRDIGVIGTDEHALADNKVKDNPYKALTAFFSSGLVQSLDNLEGNNRRKVTADLVRSLANADRDYLLMRARQITFGNTMTFNHTCTLGDCTAISEVAMDVDEDIPITYLPDNHPREDGHPVFNAVIPVGVDHGGEKQRNVTFRLPIGVDSERLSPIAKRNMAEANTAILQMIMRRVGEITRIDNGLFGRMSSKDRQFLNKALQDVTPGPKFRTEIMCAGCGSTLEISIPTAAFLSDLR